MWIKWSFMQTWLLLSWWKSDMIMQSNRLIARPSHWHRLWILDLTGATHCSFNQKIFSFLREHAFGMHVSFFESRVCQGTSHSECAIVIFWFIGGLEMSVRNRSLVMIHATCQFSQISLSTQWVSFVGWIGIYFDGIGKAQEFQIFRMIPGRISAVFVLGEETAKPPMMSVGITDPFTLPCAFDHGWWIAWICCYLLSPRAMKSWASRAQCDNPSGQDPMHDFLHWCMIHRKYGIQTFENFLQMTDKIKS